MARTDRLLADLERGFEALEEGDLAAAATAVERCRRIDGKHPDVVTLAAAVADASGEVDEALEQYALLATLRPDDPMPRICMARIQLHGNGDPDAALEAVAEAFDFIDEEEDLLEAIYVKTEALLARGESEAARETLAELASSVVEDGELALDLANLAIEAEDPAAAKRWIESAQRDPELAADALHALGRLHESTGDRAAMIAAWQQVRALDAAAPRPDVTTTEDELAQIAAETLEHLPEKIRIQLERVPVLIEDLPSEELVADGVDPRLLGLFQGTPMAEDGALAPSVTNIHLFQRNLERIAEDEDHLADEVRITVIHETAHYFGMDDDDLAAIDLD